MSRNKHPHGEAYAVGAVFSGFTVIGAYKKKRGDGANLDWYTCQCACGAVMERSKALVRRKPDSPCARCACRVSQKKRGNDGRSNTAYWRSWKSMLNRCANTDNRNYGGRGIAVCERWHSFENFKADMGARPAGLSLDRVDNSKGYSPDNCRWASPKEQARNMRPNVVYRVGALEMVAVDWDRAIGASKGTVADRIKNGWPVEAACTIPVRAKKPKKENK